MTILIKGMEMPPDIEGAEVIIHIKPDGTVFDMRGVHLQAQAVEVPTPHGRLGDLDELIKHDHQYYGYLPDEFYILVRDIENAPTIIEAEEGKA